MINSNGREKEREIDIVCEREEEENVPCLRFHSPWPMLRQNHFPNPHSPPIPL